MPLFCCANCQYIDSTVLADFFMQKYYDKVKPICCVCQGKRKHEHMERILTTDKDILSGDIAYFENYKFVVRVKSKMIDYITNYGKSCFHRSYFEKMKIEQIFEIYRKMKGDKE
jgi:hypothetical protein